jgi:hypothetical protein
MFRFANYLKSVCLAAQRAPVAAIIYGGICFLVPWATQFVLHPSDMVRFVRLFTAWPSATALYGEFAALGMLAGLGLIQLAALVALYRRGQLPVPVWPTVALVCIGIGANGGWWVYRGFFDMQGALAGLAPMAVSFLCEGKAREIAFRPSWQGYGYGGDSTYRG